MFHTLQSFTIKKTINETCLFNNQNHPDYIVKQWSNNSKKTYRGAKDYCLHIYAFNVVFHDDWRRIMFLHRYIEFMCSDTYKKLNYSIL